MRSLPLLAAVVIHTYCSFALAQPNTASSAAATDTITIAHRGAWKAMGLPENSLAALRRAIDLQCAGSEFDVWMTADDSLVVNHDPLHRGMPVESSTYASLRALPLSNGEPIPSAREYLQAGSENVSTTKLICEIKPSRLGTERGIRAAENVVRLARDAGVHTRTVYISFDYDILKAILALAPDAETQYLNGDKTPEEVKRDGIKGADYHISVFRKHPEWIGMAQRCGIALNAWTVNTQADMDWLLERGFGFITTNEPELLKERIAVFMMGVSH